MKNIPNNLKYSPMHIEIVTSIIAVTNITDSRHF